MIFRVLLLLFISSSAFAAPMTFVEMNSSGEDVVPAGYYYYDETNSEIAGSNAYPSNEEYYQNSPLFNIDYEGGYWDIRFSTHTLGGPMTVGVYDDAERFPFETEATPGIAITGNGRANNTLTGSFEVLEVEYDGETLISFAATFEQNDLVSGRISYNSEAFVPIPAGIYLLFSGFLFVTKFSFRKK